MFIPGRIEVLGKHTDYCGGRSVVCAIDRGFHADVEPRTDSVIELR
ncbi:MAG: galactokinase family protein, partial [Pyrinomonadaceae bacterium]